MGRRNRTLSRSHKRSRSRKTSRSSKRPIPRTRGRNIYSRSKKKSSTDMKFSPLPSPEKIKSMLLAYDAKIGGGLGKFIKGMTHAQIIEKRKKADKLTGECYIGLKKSNKNKIGGSGGIHNVFTPLQEGNPDILQILVSIMMIWTLCQIAYNMQKPDEYTRKFGKVRNTEETGMSPESD